MTLLETISIESSISAGLHTKALKEIVDVLESLDKRIEIIEKSLSNKITNDISRLDVLEERINKILGVEREK